VRILGICHDVLICAAALVEDGRVVAAAAEERFDRQKHSRVFPAKALEWILASRNLQLSEVDEIAVAWNPSIELESLPSGWLTRRHRGEHLHQVPTQLMRLGGGKAGDTLSIGGAFAGAPPLTFVNHHEAHVASSYLQSGWDEAAICVLDGRGERQTGLLAYGRGAEISQLAVTDYPHSMGLFYGTMTQYLGFRPDSDEWKVMALGSGVEPGPYLNLLRSLVSVQTDGTFLLDLSFFEFFNHSRPEMYSRRWVEALGPARTPNGEFNERHRQLAAACQLVFEEVGTELLTVLHRNHPTDRLCVSGGCFMNSVFNGRIASLTPFKKVFVPDAPDDSGTAAGAALWLHSQRTRRVPPVPAPDPFLGPSFTDDQCWEVVQRCRLSNATVVEDPAARAAQDLVDGKITAWFQGAMEFGQRALGHRSILLDPRRPDGKQILNAAVKYREEFRPFAPAILSEHVTDWFDCAGGTAVPFMEKVIRFRPDKVALVPAVVHVDGSGRVQTVESRGSRFRSLVEHFHDLTGIPIVLNTSFNLNGEPIVCSPIDAIRTFYSCGLDVMYLGNVKSPSDGPGHRRRNREVSGSRLTASEVLGPDSRPLTDASTQPSRCISEILTQDAPRHSCRW
jgi:carbamoyltransferase